MPPATRARRARTCSARSWQRAADKSADEAADEAADEGGDGTGGEGGREGGGRDAPGIGGVGTMPMM